MFAVEGANIAAATGNNGNSSSLQGEMGDPWKLELHWASSLWSSPNPKGQRIDKILMPISGPSQSQEVGRPGHHACKRLSFHPIKKKKAAIEVQALVS